MLGGMHIHDVIPPIYDHQMPPLGMVDFKGFATMISATPIAVLEPHSDLAAEQIKTGIKYLLELMI
jgi:hypothetical protein